MISWSASDSNDLPRALQKYRLMDKCRIVSLAQLCASTVLATVVTKIHGCLIGY